MRIRATVAAVTGALALSAFAVPAAQAAEPKVPADIAAASEVVHADSGRSAFAGAVEGEPYALNATFSSVKVNNGKNISVGTTNLVKVPVSFKLTHGADVDIHADDFFAGIELYRGASFEESAFFFDSNDASCTDSSATVANCKATVEIDPFALLNEDAGSWKAAGFAVAFNGENPDEPNLDKVGVAVTDPTNSFKLQRFSKLTVNASPEPVKKGKTITVTGKLSRANWDDNKYHGYTNQSVKLQFRKKNSDTYTTVKTIKSNSTGELKTTVKASVDGYFRYSFAGTTTTPAVNAAGDFVDVQ
ncbi:MULTISPECIES: hypothetical protein [Streptomyces]|uniref:Lipoprotein n=1 Tax=Streptomyces koelreuteriae TaxID=2838015 RepID=A0ABX8FUX8_9ACTN|nr:MULTISPECIES: hypothetical protein [Streptomyces]QWB24864.1 hypothetical protein KJK29_21035 [Streptomyces koelreuteriae]UUA07880.1 hypothetical protein NNW98_21160 [Streptomyces koelreuteriae]UUA15509.1 hypothetical protein NNW99_21155 [Streptomyces sp. CRCS-T-1]